MSNKVEFGLSKLHYAPITESGGTITFGTPIPIPGAVSLTQEPLGNSTTFYADNVAYYVVNTNQGYESTLTIANIPQDFAVYALGEEIDEADGVMHELANAQGGSFALLFQIEGDVKETLHVLYNCKAARPSLSANTKQESTEVSPNELTLTASPIEIDGKLLVKTKTTTTTSEAIRNAWFDAVYRKNAGA